MPRGEIIRPTKKVYVAGPYSNGGKLGYAHRESCTNVAAAAGAQLMAAGFLPFVPHTSHYIDRFCNPRPTFESWMKWCLAWLDDCDALWLLPGDSAGAKIECAYALDHFIPIYTSLKELIEKEA